MDVKVEIDRASRRKMEETLRKFAEATGKTAEGGIQMIAASAGRRLAHTVQPYGLNDAKGAKFQSSIGGQVYRAVQNANVKGASGGAAQVHKRSRNSRGQVPRDLVATGKFQREPISIAEREQHAKVQKQKAGRAKGAWVEAANKIGKAKLSGIAQWIQRHATGGYGECHKTGEGLKHTVTLENRTPYLGKIQKDRDIAAAVAYGLKNGFKRIQKIIDKQAEKASRAMQ